MQTVPTYAEAPQYTKSGFGMRCSTTQPSSGENRPDQFVPQLCDTGLVCYNGFCVKDIGTTCNNVWECIPGTKVCNGHCSMTGRAGLNSICGSDNDCDTGLVCDNLFCKRDTNFTCGSTSDCATGNYCNTVCTPQSQPTQLCTNINNEKTCVSGFVCSSSNPNPEVPTTVVYPNFCQPQGITTGTIGAYCYFWTQFNAPPVTDGNYKFIGPSNDLVPVPACDTNSVCSMPRNESGDPINSPLTGYGTCGLIGDWNGTCDNVTGCQLPQVCINGTCNFPVDEKGKLPLACDPAFSTGVCLTGYRCSSDYNQCLGLNSGNIPANNASFCASGHISPANQIVYQFFQKNVEPIPTRLTNASWLNANIILPSALTGVPYYNLTFTSFHSVNGIAALFHIFGSNVHYICSSTSFILSTLSSNIVGTFLTTITYTGTDQFGDPIQDAVDVTYTSSVDYVGYTTRGNYYAGVRYTISTPVNFPSPVFPNVPQPLFTDFTRIYYDSDPTFANNILTFDSVTGVPTYTKYFEYSTDVIPMVVKYIYSISVDDRIINPDEPNSVRFFMVVQTGSSDDALPPTTAVNDPIDATLVQRSGALISINVNDYTTSSDFYPLIFVGLSYSIFITNYGTLEYNMVWCQCYIFRTMTVLNPEKQCFARENGTVSDIGLVRMYQSTTGQFYVLLFPYISREGQHFRLRQISMYTSRSFDITQASITYIVNDRNGDYLSLSYLFSDNSIAANVGSNTSVSVPFVSAQLDILGYLPRVLLYTPVCVP